MATYHSNYYVVCRYIVDRKSKLYQIADIYQIAIREKYGSGILFKYVFIAYFKGNSGEQITL